MTILVGADACTVEGTRKPAAGANSPPRPIFSIPAMRRTTPQSRQQAWNDTSATMPACGAQSGDGRQQASRACSCQGDPTGTNSGFNDTVPRASGRPSTCHLEGSPITFFRLGAERMPASVKTSVLRPTRQAVSRRGGSPPQPGQTDPCCQARVPEVRRGAPNAFLTRFSDTLRD